MKRKCSLCKEKGHDKRQCPAKKKEQAEKIKIQRDRTNMLIQVLPDIIGSPVGQTMLWWLLSRHIKILGEVNAVILGKQAIELFPAVDLDPLPAPMVAGALIEKTEDALGYRDEFATLVSQVIGIVSAEAVGEVIEKTPENPTGNPWPEGGYYWRRWEEKHKNNSS